MPVTNDLDLPIKRVTISGPGVDALECRKEKNDHHRVSATELRNSFGRVKEALYSGFKTLTKAVAR